MKTRLLIIMAITISILFMISNAHAHEVFYPATTFVRITDETFDKSHMQTGETLTIEGKITSNVDKDIPAWMSIFSESSYADNRWEILARDPPTTVFDVVGGSSVDYSITVKALYPGTYHIHSQFNLDKIGPQLGPGQMIVVTGEPIDKPSAFTNTAYELILLGIGCAVAISIVYCFWRKIK
ncbi:MAG: methane monooxygenase/ammonia monooxygenase subunit B [Candidatus Nitrosopumilus sp. bin_7KS]